MYEEIHSMSLIFFVLVYTVLCCEPKEAISLEQENRFRNGAALSEMMQTASSDVLNFTCRPDDLECKRMHLRMPTDTNEQGRQRKRCETCIKSYRCAKLRKCEPCDKICRNDFIREMENVGSVNKVDGYSTYFTLGEFGPGFQMDQILDFIGFPEEDKYDKLIIIGKTKDQNGIKKCKALLIDAAESFKDINEVKCAGMVLKKTETAKFAAPSNIQEYIETPENNLRTEMGTEKTITVTENNPLIENILNSDFGENTQKELENASKDQIKLTGNMKAAKTRIEATKINERLRKGNISFQSEPETVTETIKGILEIKNNSDALLMESITEMNSAQNSDSLLVLRQGMNDSNDVSTGDEKFNLLSSSELKMSENLTLQEDYLHQNLSLPYNLSITRQSKPQQHTSTRLQSRKNNRGRPNIVSNRHRVYSNLAEKNSNVEEISSKEDTNPLQGKDSSLSNEFYYGINKRIKGKEPLNLLENKSSNMVGDQIEPAESNINQQVEYSSFNKDPSLMRSGGLLNKKEQPITFLNSLNSEEKLESVLETSEDKLLAPVKTKEILKAKYFEENKTFDTITELPEAADKVTKIDHDVTDGFIHKSSTTDFLQEEYRELEQLQRLYITTPKIDTIKRKWKGGHLSATKKTTTEHDKSMSFNDNTNVPVSFETQEAKNTKSANLEANDSLPHSKEIRIQLKSIENEFNQSTEKSNEVSDSSMNESEIDNIQFEKSTTISSESTKEEIPLGDANQNSNTLISSESRETNTILSLMKQKYVPTLKATAFSSINNELLTVHDTLSEPNSNMTYLNSNQIKDKSEEPKVSKSIKTDIDHEENLDSLVEASRSNDNSTETLKGDHGLLKQSLKSANRRLKTPKNTAFTGVPQKDIDTTKELSLITGSSKLEVDSTNIDSEEKLKASAHMNKKLKAKHASPTKIDLNVAHTKQMDNGGIALPNEQLFTDSTDDESDMLSGIHVKTEPSSLENVLKAKHLDSLVQELEQLPPLIYDRALKVSSALSKLQSTSPPSKNLIQLLSTKKSQQEQSKNDFVETDESTSLLPNLVEQKIKSDEKRENLNEPFATSEEAISLLKSNNNKDKIISSEGNTKSKELKIVRKYNPDVHYVDTSIKDAEEFNEKLLKVNKNDSFLKKKSDKTLKENFDDIVIPSNDRRQEKAKKIVGKPLKSISITTDTNDQVGSSNPELVSKENIFTNFGKVIPNLQDSKSDSLTDKVLFLGNDIHLPLNAKKNEDGSYKLSLDIQKLCDCKDVGCTKHTSEIEVENRKVRGASHASSDTAAQDKLTAFSDFLGQLRKIPKTTSHSEFSKSQHNNELLKLISSIRSSHDV